MSDVQWLSDQEVGARFGCSSDWVRSQSKEDPKFPKPVKLGQGAIRWNLGEIEKYERQLLDARTEQPELKKEADWSIYTAEDKEYFAAYVEHSKELAELSPLCKKLNAEAYSLYKEKERIWLSTGVRNSVLENKCADVTERSKIVFNRFMRLTDGRTKFYQLQRRFQKTGKPTPWEQIE